ncbi:F-box/LRR-repeat protein 12-like [Papaver somniferum]|uniref:F-box/LRR-repeat protein 12-like n=1 Tax=Papaver somniferum TaxID=3469 RepID=UPI000E6FD869|nr:F-box/LRR-repeat protein 12-like [Papaver somniferum]
MSLLSNDKHSQLSGKTPTSSFTTDLPGDCLNLIFNGLKTRDDRNSFGLTCHQWLCIQNNNRESLWFRNRDKDPRISLLILYKLLSRFPNLKCLFLTSGLPKITYFLISKKLFFESKVQYLYLDYYNQNADIELSSMFSWFPHLTFIRLRCSHITDKGLESLLKCCPSLKKVRLTGCHSITDLGIRSLIENCQQLGSLCISSCSKITGIGFLECAKTLTYVGAGGCKLKVEGINAILSSGAIRDLFGKECINPEAVMTI